MTTKEKDQETHEPIKLISRIVNYLVRNKDIPEEEISIRRFGDEENPHRVRISLPGVRGAYIKRHRSKIDVYPERYNRQTSSFNVEPFNTLPRRIARRFSELYEEQKKLKQRAEDHKKQQQVEQEKVKDDLLSKLKACNADFLFELEDYSNAIEIEYHRDEKYLLAIPDIQDDGSVLYALALSGSYSVFVGRYNKLTAEEVIEVLSVLRKVAESAAEREEVK